MKLNKTFISLLFVGILACCFPDCLHSKNMPADSLRRLLAQTSHPLQRIELLGNLNDYCHNVTHEKDAFDVTYQLLNESLRAKYEYGITKALRQLVMRVDKRERNFANDSVNKYLGIAEQHLTGEGKACFITEIHMRQIRSMVDWTVDSEGVMAQITKKYTTTADAPEDIYKQIEQEYAFGKANSYLLHNWTENLHSSLRYFDELLVLMERLPVKYRANLLMSISDNFFTAYFNAGEKGKAVRMLRLLMATIEEYKKQEAVKKECYLDFSDCYALYYGGMARSPEIIGSTEAWKNMQEADKLFRRLDGFLETLYYTYKEYYSSVNNHWKVLLYSDSIMAVVQSSGYTETRSIMSSLYKEQAEHYGAIGDYEKAYDCFLKYDVIKDSLANDESKQLRQEMSVRYDVNRLELENIQLQSRNRKIGLVSAIAVLILSIVWGVQQRVQLKRLQKVQKRLIESTEEVVRQSAKAQESEQMKTAFINSMCHEIRTPLNSINGFSSLLFDDSIEDELKQEFPELISQNVNQLTGLINNLLDVSSLDSSSEELPVDWVDLAQLIRQEVHKLTTICRKSGIDYRIEIADEENWMVYTHAAYFSQVMDNLLSNANKFTTQGSITIACRRDKEEQTIEVSVTDTGIGIPADKSDWVFERFTKIDDFQSGTGLGLYVCRLIMNRLNGSIAVDTTYQQGTRMRLTLSCSHSKS